MHKKPMINLDRPLKTKECPPQTQQVGNLITALKNSKKGNYNNLSIRVSADKFFINKPDKKVFFIRYPLPK